MIIFANDKQPIVEQKQTDEKEDKQNINNDKITY